MEGQGVSLGASTSPRLHPAALSPFMSSLYGSISQVGKPGPRTCHGPRSQVAALSGSVHTHTALSLNPQCTRQGTPMGGVPGSWVLEPGPRRKRCTSRWPLPQDGALAATPPLHQTALGVHHPQGPSKPSTVYPPHPEEAHTHTLTHDHTWSPSCQRGTWANKGSLNSWGHAASVRWLRRGAAAPTPGRPPGGFTLTSPHPKPRARSSPNTEPDPNQEPHTIDSTACATRTG